MVEPLNTKAKPVEAQPIHALPMPGTMPVSGSPAPPAVDGGKLLDLISQYWDLAYAEGLSGASHDTKAGDAQRCLSAILAMASAAESRVQSLEEEVKNYRRALLNLHEAVDCEIDIGGRSSFFRKKVVEARAALSQGEKP